MVGYEYEIKNILEARSFGEGTVWDLTKNLLYWMDIYNHQVHQFNPAIGKDIFVDVGDVVYYIMTAAPIIGVEEDIPKNRFNDGKCDSQGCF